MTIAFDAVSFSGTNQGTDITISHTPVGTPKAAIGIVIQRAPATDSISGITYGGTSLTEMTGSPWLSTNSEPFAIHAFLLGSSVSTGAQDLVVTPTATAGRLCAVITLTGAADIEQNTTETAILLDTTTANPSSVLSLGSIESFVIEMIGSGWSAITNIAPNSGWTDRAEFDLGSSVAGVYSYDTIGTADVTCGYSASSDEVTLAAIAVNEIAGGLEEALTSTLATTATGSATPSTSKAISGQSAALSVGSFSPSVSVSITGVNFSYSLDSLNPSAQKSITGLANSWSVGTVSPPASGVEEALTGVLSTLSVGSVTPSISASVTGLDLASSIGSLSTSLSKAITGNSGAFSVDSASPAVSLGLSGLSGVYGLGSVSVDGSTIIALSGVSSAYGLDGVSVSATKAITGINASYSINSMSKGISASLSGQQAGYSVGSITPSSRAALAGNSALYLSGTVAGDGELLISKYVIAPISVNIDDNILTSNKLTALSANKLTVLTANSNGAL